MAETSPSRGRALLALLRPDARRWVVLGALVTVSVGADAGRSARRASGSSTAATTAPRPPSWRRLATAVPGHRARHPGHRRRRRPAGDDHGVGHDQRAAPAHHPPRARPRPRVPPPAHPRRADPARRRRRHVGVRVPRPRRAEGRRRAAPARRGMLVVLTVLDWRLGVGMAVFIAIAVVLIGAWPAPRRPRVGRRAGRLRPAVRRHRGAADGGRGPAGQRRRRARASGASSRTRRRRSTAVRRERAFLHLWWTVQSAVTVGSVPGARRSARCSSPTGYHGRHRVPAVPVRAARHPAAGGAGPRAGDGAEGQRRDGPRRRPARRRSRRSSMPARRRRRRARWPSTCTTSRSTTATTRRSSTTSTSRSAPAARSASSAAPAAARPRSPGCCCASSRRPAAPCGSAVCRSPTSRWPSCAGASPSCRRRSSCSRARSATTSPCSTPPPSDDDVVDALHRAGLDALRAGGIDRLLGAGGAGLSAGEAQLLALARVWLRRPDLVVLDEATARIDPVTEAPLEAAVAELMAGRTTLDHRPQAVDAADGRRGRSCSTTAASSSTTTAPC